MAVTGNRVRDVAKRFCVFAKACCEMSRRDGAIVAWHEVPGTAPPQKSRPVGYGVIRAGLRTDSMIGMTKSRIRKLKTFMLYNSGGRYNFFPWQTLSRA
jgi:hypothetical protein